MKVTEFYVQRRTVNLLRESEVGPIPQDWEVIELAARATIQSGIAKNANATLRDPLSVPYLRVANVQDGYLDLGEVSTIDIERADLNRYAVLPGDVLMNEGGDLDKLGRGALWRGQISPCVHQNHVFVVRCKDGLVPEYLNAWTSSAQARRYFILAGRQTTNLASINKTSLGELTIAVPPTEDEQHQIAKALTDTDALIDSLEQLLIKKRQIKQGVMQEVLTGKRRLPGFSGDWDEAALGSLLHSRPDYGINAPAVRYTPSLPTYLRITDIDDEGRFLAGSVVSVDRPDADLYYLNPGDVVFARTGASVGKTYLHKESVGPLVFAGFLIRVQPIVAKLVPAYLFYFSQTRRYWKWVTLMSMRSGQPGINGQELATMPIPLPKIDEQHAIASVLEDIDAEINALEARLAKNRAFKQAVAQALLTGRIRLVEPNA